MWAFRVAGNFCVGKDTQAGSGLKTRQNKKGTENRLGIKERTTFSHMATSWQNPLSLLLEQDMHF